MIVSELEQPSLAERWRSTGTELASLVQLTESYSFIQTAPILKEFLVFTGPGSTYEKRWISRHTPFACAKRKVKARIIFAIGNRWKPEEQWESGTRF